MKIEALLLKYLSEKKSLSLQYIGYFEVTLEEQVDSNQNNEIDFIFSSRNFLRLFCERATI